jgi:hypothetical protein
MCLWQGCREAWQLYTLSPRVLLSPCILSLGGSLRALGLPEIVGNAFNKGETLGLPVVD